MDDAAWAALAVSLTVLGGIYTWFAFRRRGLASGLRGAGLTLIPMALLLTDTLQLASDIGGSILDWAGDLVFSPSMWLGVVLGAVAGVLLVVSGFLRGRAKDDSPGRGTTSATAALPASAGSGGSPVADPIDAEMAEIEALLRKRGIT